MRGPWHRIRQVPGALPVVSNQQPRSAVLTLFETNDRFHGRQCFHGLGAGVRRDASGMILLWSTQPRSLIVHFTVGFELLQESNASADVTGGRAQVVMPAMGSNCKYR